MNRNALSYLDRWAHRKTRKPLVIRGARQVGKSYLVRLFAERENFTLVEINFDLSPGKKEIFQSKDPEQIVSLIEVMENCDIERTKTVLFLDEIQAAPEVFAALRYFYEKIPELRVIAAGSLLDFALESHTFSMPVGRIEYLHLGPMQFDEFLDALGEKRLLQFIRSFTFDTTIPTIVHEQLITRLKQFMVLGGMPEVVKLFAETASMQECERIKSSIIETYRDDFSKYQEKLDIPLLQRIFAALPAIVAEKIKYVKLDRNEKACKIESALHMFELAHVIYRVTHSACNGIPLAAEENKKSQKLLYLDVGLLSHILGINMMSFLASPEQIMSNAGASCEQYIGQHLLYRNDFYIRPELHYWVREKKGASSEVDYVIAHRGEVIPVEVKAGKTGRLRSLQVFLEEKELDRAVRFNMDVPSKVKTQTVYGQRNFTLYSLPFYLITELNRLLGEK